MTLCSKSFHTTFSPLKCCFFLKKINIVSTLLLQTIPDKFARHFKGVISKTIKLEPRSGYTFDVQVTKKLNILVLGSGWESFVNAHDLNMGDFLVFKYNGDFLLQVLIFDPSGCEKSTSCSMENAIDHVGQGWKEHNDISTSYHDQPKGNKHWMQKDSSSKGNKIGNTRSSNTPSKFSGNNSDYQNFILAQMYNDCT